MNGRRPVTPEASGGPTRREIATHPAMLLDWAVRTVTAGVLAEVGLTDDAADLAQLGEFSTAMFAWPGLLERAGRILTSARHTLTEAFLLEHQARPGVLPETYQVLREGLGDDVLAVADDARIGVLPHRIGQQAWTAMSVGVQLLHFRHGARSQEIQRLRDAAQVGLMQLYQDLAEWALTHPEACPSGLPGQARTAGSTSWPRLTSEKS
ncbi:MAG: hypothetical protein ACR2M5_11615 [Nakamurella sp.]